jgi:hypothetical protein
MRANENPLMSPISLGLSQRVSNLSNMDQNRGISIDVQSNTSEFKSNEPGLFTNCSIIDKKGAITV